VLKREQLATDTTHYVRADGGAVRRFPLEASIKVLEEQDEQNLLVVL